MIFITNEPEGINAEILDSLETKQRIWRSFNLWNINQKFAEFSCSELSSESRARSATSIVKEVLEAHGKESLGRYMADLAQIETGVQKINPELRDHVSHSVYTFFLGLYFKSKLPQIKIRRPLSWKLAAFLHDIGYPVEHYTRLIGEYLNSVNSLKMGIINNIQLSRVPYSINIKNLEKLVSGRNAFELIKSRLEKWDLTVDIKEIYYRKMSDGIVDHGILSALVVLNIVDALFFHNNPHNLKKHDWDGPIDWSINWFYRDNLDAASAIAVHNLPLNKLGSRISFEKAPLLYLLLLCDSLQIWDRYSPKKLACGPNSIKMEFKENKIICNLKLPDEEFQEVKNDVGRLQSSQIELELIQEGIAK